MNADELMKRVVAYGADEEGLRDRFADNAELYASCFGDFLEEPNFAALDEAIKTKNYARAFEAAHALKGLSGNLGITPFYDAICTLVESLRAQSYGAVAEEYESVCRQRGNLFNICSDGDAEPDAPSPWRASGGSGPEEAPKGKKNIDRFMPRFIAITLVIFLIVGYMFGKLGSDYRNNIVVESGYHLTEMSNQIKLYIEEEVANDWRIALSVGDSITHSGYGDDAAMLEMMQRKREVWGVTDLVLYTENGYCVNAGGVSDTNDVSSEIIVKAREFGRYMSVVDSSIIYSVPLETEIEYSGSRIAAVSVVQDMKTFLDDMNFSSFDEEAWMYLAAQNGVVISVLSNEDAMPAFNFKAVMGDSAIEPLGGGEAEDMFTSQDPAAFMMDDGEEKIYVVSVPIATSSSPLRLFYLAPEAVVNDTMNGFSRRLTMLSTAIIVLFAALAFLTFVIIYRSRKKLFDKELLARERMFDLLVKNTKTSFALFTVNQAEPTYISSNAQSVVGDKYWVLERDESGYRVRNNTSTDTSIIHAANEMLRGWDGKSVFESGYIRNDRSAAPSWFDYQLYPVDGEGRDFVGIAQDMTPVYEREQAAKNAMELATRANEAKSKFLSNMSHDIRTPMNAIMNMTNFALENIDRPKKLGPYLRTIRESSEHLLHLINEVLDMSRIESGQTVVASSACDIRAEIQKQADMLRPLSEAKGQTLITDFSGLSDTPVLADALKLSQIVMNLLSNAVKFTPENGAIRFTAADIPSLRDDMLDVRFTVEDNGIGISEQSLAKIFDPFFHASDKRVGKIEGTGLGLSICRAYVDAMGGTIKCESEEGEGSVFTVELFFKKVGEETVESRAAAELGDTPYLGLHCLVAEDNATNQLIARALLERLGFIVEFADDGGECVKRFENSKPGTYDVIFMDIRMPVLDGYQAANQIRLSEHAQAQTIPIVAMTANVFAEDIEKARIAGMDAYVGKPIVSFDLIEQTNKALNNRRGQRI